MYCVIFQMGGTYHGSSLAYNYLRNGPAGQSAQSAGLRPQHSSGGTGPYGKRLPLFLWRLRVHSFQRDHDHEHPAPDLRHLHLPVELLLIRRPCRKRQGLLIAASCQPLSPGSTRPTPSQKLVLSFC